MTVPVALTPGVRSIALPVGPKVSCTVDGHGRPLVMLGGPHTAELMRGFLREAFEARGKQLVTTEYRGVPPSDVPPGDYVVPDLASDVAGVLDALGAAPYDVFGYSLGSLVLQQLLITRKDLLGRAVLAGTRMGPGVVYRRMHEEFLSRGESGSRPSLASETLMRALLMFGPKRLSNDAFAATIAEVLGYSPTEGYNARGLTNASLEYIADPDRLAEVTTPSRVIGMQHDVLTPASGARRVADALPEAEYVEVRNTGHGIFIERSQELVRLVCEFVDDDGVLGTSPSKSEEP